MNQQYTDFQIMVGIDPSSGRPGVSLHMDGKTVFTLLVDDARTLGHSLIEAADHAVGSNN